MFRDRFVQSTLSVQISRPTDTPIGDDPEVVEKVIECVDGKQVKILWKKKLTKIHKEGEKSGFWRIRGGPARFISPK